MAAVRYTERALAHLERVTEFLDAKVPAAAAETAALVFEAINILHSHPEIGRPGEGDFRELVISRGNTGYVALYIYDEYEDLVVVHAIRHQREAGFS